MQDATGRVLGRLVGVSGQSYTFWILPDLDLEADVIVSTPVMVTTDANERTGYGQLLYASSDCTGTPYLYIAPNHGLVDYSTGRVYKGDMTGRTTFPLGSSKFLGDDRCYLESDPPDFQIDCRGCSPALDLGRLPAIEFPLYLLEHTP